MAIPDPTTFIGAECVIVLKKGRKRIIRRVKSIDATGVHVETEDGPHLYKFSEIAMMNLKKR